MTFLERWYSAVIIAYDWFIWNFIYYPIQEGLANKYFAHLGPLPPLSALIRNVSLTLVNSHRAIAPPRPSMPSMYSESISMRKYNGPNRFFAFCFFNFSDVISIGGAHIKPSKPLPNDLQMFLDGAEAAEHGVIYFSLGSILHTSKLPKNLIQTFLGRSNHVEFGIHRTHEWN